MHRGEHINLQFEDGRTIRCQIREVLRTEKIFEDDSIQREIEACAPLLPDGHNWKATVRIEHPDPHERKREGARLIGVEDRQFVEAEGHARVYAIADEDLDREKAEKAEKAEKISAEYFARVEFNPLARAAVRAGAAVKLGCDPARCPSPVQTVPETPARLAGDLR